jgi:hypothetical protein
MNNSISMQGDFFYYLILRSYSSIQFLQTLLTTQIFFKACLTGGLRWFEWRIGKLFMLKMLFLS